MSLLLRHSFLLFVTAAIWGTGFVAQALGMEHISPFAYTWGRSAIGCVFLLVLMPFLDRLRGIRPKPGEPNLWKNKSLWIGGTACGLMLFISESLQQFGLLYTEVGKAAFITGLYIVFVPVISALRGRGSSVTLWLAVFLAVLGMWFLSVKEGGFSLSLGDTLVLLCAVSFSLHILVIDHFAPKGDGVRMSCIQFAVGSVVGGVCMMFFDPPTLKDLMAAMLCLLYSGCLSNGVAYTLQIVAQKGMNPTVASLIMSLESAVGALAGWLILGQVLTGREILGCVIMAVAIVLAQIPKSWLKISRKTHRSSFR